MNCCCCCCLEIENDHEHTQITKWTTKWKTGGVRVVDMLCGAYHTIALSSEGACFSWGCNNNGQLGLGRFGGEEVTTPSRIERLPRVCFSFFELEMD